MLRTGEYLNMNQVIAVGNPHQNNGAMVIHLSAGDPIVLSKDNEEDKDKVLEWIQKRVR